MKLVAEILTGTFFYVEVRDDATVGDTKKAIGNQENLPTGRLILMLDADGQNFVLDDNEVRLKDYGVKDNSHIYIFFEPLVEDFPLGSPKTPRDFDLNEPPSNDKEPSPSVDSNSDHMEE